MSPTKNLVQSSLKMPFKRLRFWNNSWLLTPYGCPEFIFVRGAGLGVRTVTHLHDGLIYHHEGRNLQTIREITQTIQMITSNNAQNQQ